MKKMFLVLKIWFLIKVLRRKYHLSMDIGQLGSDRTVFLIFEQRKNGEIYLVDEHFV